MSLAVVRRRRADIVMLWHIQLASWKVGRAEEEWREEV